MAKGMLEHTRLLFTLVAVGLFASAAGAQWPIVRVTNSPRISDSVWDLDGDSIVGSRNGSTIVLYKNGGEQVLSSGGWDLQSWPRISGDNVVWEARDTGYHQDFQVYLYDGATTRMLSDPSYFNTGPEASGQYVSWVGVPDGTGEIFLYDGQTIQQITNNSVSDGWHAMDGNHIVWQRKIGGLDYIYYYDGTSVQQLTDGSWHQPPQVSGDNVAWVAYDDHDTELFLYDGQSVTQISDSIHDVGAFDIEGDSVVWEQENDSLRPDIYYFDGTNAIRVTDNSNWSKHPKLSNGRIVWQEEAVGGHVQVFLYYEGETYQLTDAPFHSTGPQISGDTIAWNTNYDGYQDIYMMTIPEPATMSLLAIGGLALLRRRKLHALRRPGPRFRH